MNTKEHQNEPANKDDHQRVSAAVQGVRAVESMNMEIEALRRQNSQHQATVNSIRAEHVAAIEENHRLQYERDYYMNLVASMRTQAETVLAAANKLQSMILEKNGPEAPLPLSKLIDQLDKKEETKK